MPNRGNRIEEGQRYLKSLTKRIEDHGIGHDVGWTDREPAPVPPGTTEPAKKEKQKACAMKPAFSVA